MLILRSAVLWDGLHDDMDRVDIVCDEGRVLAVERAGTVRPGDDDLVMDLDGATVLPGLIDAHVHLVWSGGIDPVGLVEQEGRELTLIRAAENARSQLAAGVTTVRDLGSNWDLAIHVARAVERGALEGPTIIASGKTVIMTGGHDPFWGLPCDGVDGVVKGVRTQVAKGAGVIKTASTGGVYGQEVGEKPAAGELTYEELRALATEAHRRGRRVAVHALGTEGIRDAVRAGVDTIEHGAFLTEDIVELMVRQGTVLCPTLATYQRIAAGHAPDYARRKALEVTSAHQRSMAMAIDAGITIIAGTDAGAPGMAHPSLIDEVEALIAAGVDKLSALRAATSTAADALDQPLRGRVVPGAKADLVILDGDPLSDPGVLRSVWGVVREQRVVR